MPTIEEFDELKTKCIWTWAKQNNHVGYKVMGKNGNSIFFPAAGYYDGKARKKIEQATATIGLAHSVIPNLTALESYTSTTGTFTQKPIVVAISDSQFGLS